MGGRHSNASALTARVAKVPSPAGMLYAHALESIFAFATLQELSRLLAVCRGWQAAVLSLRLQALSWSIDSAYTPALQEHRMDTVALISASRLRRHISHIGRENA